MGKMKDLHIVIEELLETDHTYEEIVEQIQESSIHFSPEYIMEIIMDVETQLAIRYKDIEDYDIMDGDHASALASAGWGTDEDYGYASDEY